MNSLQESWCYQGELTSDWNEIWYHDELHSHHYTYPFHAGTGSYTTYDTVDVTEPEAKSLFSSVAVIIPAFNEGRIIGTVVSEAKKYVATVIVIDDGSSDNTSQEAALSGANVIRLSRNQGKAAAVMTGCRYAKQCGFETIIMLDGDGQHDPNEIPVLAAPVMTGSADLVIGSRFLGEKNPIPRYRVAGQQVLNEFTRLASQVKITDTQSGFRVLGKRALDNLNFHSRGYNLESDMITHFAGIGMRITEIPITVRYDVPNKHKMNPLMHGIGILTHLLYDIARKNRFITSVPSMTSLIFGAALFFAFLTGLFFRPNLEIHLLSIGLFTMIMSSYSIVYHLIHRR